MMMKEENREISQIIFMKATVSIDLQQISIFAIISKHIQYKIALKA